MWFGIWASLALLFVLSLAWHVFRLVRKAFKSWRAVTANLEKVTESVASPDLEQKVQATLSIPRQVDVFGGPEQKVLLREQVKASRYARKRRREAHHEETYARWRAFNR